MEYEIEYIQAKSGIQTVKVNGYFLHSKYDPIKEAQRICEKEYTENYVHIIFGYGMGYIVEELKKKLKNEEILLVVDPLKKELKINDEKIIAIEDSNVFKEQLENTLEHYSREIKVICSPNYERIALDSYKTILDIVKDIQMTNMVYDNTIQLWSEKWQENSIHNLVFLTKDEPLNVLYEFTDKPIIIASGGPSLSKQLPLLRDIRENVIVMAAGSTINSLLANNIKPDYVVSIDGGTANYNHFKEIESDGTVLIYGVSSHYKIQKEWKNNRFVFAGIEDMDLQKKVKEKYGVDLPSIAGGGSVANYCYTIASKMTTGPIALIGQDLAYTNLQSHASGNKANKMLTQEYLLSRNAYVTLDYEGKEVYTDYAFYAMKKSFEDLVQNSPHQAGIYNCTEGGIPIEGFVNNTFEKFIRDFVHENTYVGKVKFSPHVDWEIIRVELMNEIKFYTILEEACFNLVLSIKRDFQQKYFSSDTLKRLKRTDAQLKEIIENELMIQSILEPLIKQVLTKYKGNSEENEIQKFERVYQQNLTWYNGLQEIMKKMKQFTKSAIQLGDEIV